MNNKHKVAIFAAGTGGHVYPGLSIARELIKQDVDIIWIGTKHGIEKKIIGESEIPINYIKFSGIRGKGLKSYIKLPLMLAVGTIQALKILLKNKPNIVLSMGGYISFPCAIASYILRIPIITHEQNIIFGLTNNILRFISKKIILGFPMKVKNKKYIYLGNPSRYEKINIKKNKAIKGKLNILVVGGSLGAKIFNDIVPKAIYILKQNLDYEINVMHQTGKTYEVANSQYKKFQINIDLKEFIDPMIDAYKWCDIIICRGGALTITEIMNLGIPSIIIPYPYAVDDHQMKNSRYLEENDAAIVINQKFFTDVHLANTLESFINNNELEEKLSKNISKLNKSDSTKKICEAIIKGIN